MILAPLACVALSLWVHRRALSKFFSLDDLVILEEMRGLRASPVSLWRFLSRHVYFRAAVLWFDSNPLPYHLVSAALHAVNVVLIFRLVGRLSGSLLAATVAAALFGSTRLHLNVMGSAATVGEPLALAFTLGALQLADRGRVARIAATLLFLCALLSKEGVVLLPAVLLVPRPGAGPLRERLTAAWPLLAMSAAFSFALLASGALSTRLGGEAYARAFGGNLFSNFMTYAAWALDLTDPFVGRVSAIDPRAWPIGLAVSLGLLALVVLLRRTTPLPAFGAAWWLLGMLPVLPLLHHTYLYYLYVPVAGLAVAVAGVVGWIEQRLATRPNRQRPRREVERPRAAASTPAGRLLPWIVALLLVVHAASADHMLAARYAARVPGMGVPVDSDLCHSEVARNAYDEVRRTLDGRPGRVAFLQPPGLGDAYQVETGERSTPGVSGSTRYSVLAGALDQGLGLRALLPNVDSVAFLPGWRPGYAEFELFGGGYGGTVFPLGRGADGYARAGALIIGGGIEPPGRELIENALTEFPSHPGLHYQHARALYFAGDSMGMERKLDELVRRFPNDSMAIRVRAAKTRVGSPAR